MLRFLWLLSFACLQVVERGRRHPKTLSLKGQALGTTWTVKLISSKPIDEDELQAELVAKIEETEKIFSIGDRIPNSTNNASLSDETLRPPCFDDIAQAREVDA